MIRHPSVPTTLICVTYGDRAVNEDEPPVSGNSNAGHPMANTIYLGYIYWWSRSLNSIRDIERIPIWPLPLPVHRREERLVIPDERVTPEPILRSLRALIDDLLRRDRHVLQGELILGRH